MNSSDPAWRRLQNWYSPADRWIGNMQTSEMTDEERSLWSRVEELWRLAFGPRRSIDPGGAASLL